MNLEFSPDQAAVLDAVDRIVARHATVPATATRWQYSSELAHDLADAGLFACIDVEELGPVTAAAMVMALAALPSCAETVASAFVAPRIDAALRGPFAVVSEGAESSPTRFLPVAGTVVRIGNTHAYTATLDTAGEVEALDSIFAYPMGRLRAPASLPWRVASSVDAAALHRSWQLGIAAELVGCLAAGLRSVLEHVRERRQFGRPLGSFQAVQHRLAECGTAIEGARWLVLQAAHSQRQAEVLLAMGQAQRIATRVCYDLHQFMGAMGLTLEHPLHRWTYRAKLLRSEMGGAPRQFIAAARLAWNTAPARAAAGGTALQEAAA